MAHNPYAIILILLLFISVVCGCIETRVETTRYVCCDGKIVNNSDECATIITTSTTTTSTIPSWCKVFSESMVCVDDIGIHCVEGFCNGTKKVVTFWVCDDEKNKCKPIEDKFDCSSVGSVCMKGDALDIEMSPLRVVVCGRDRTYYPGRIIRERYCGE